ncbi:hypothetical protein EUX98_g6179 [Antrodiella citrinella]|uniref:Uncharacterized protein n=1 Tax=Antrodiella citrinella TaxID=2447956 RepID=A0A4V3XI64_9APHY|nr:hypothetical protein EUX98_g6179 [Antrodiella citrinella]
MNPQYYQPLSAALHAPVSVANAQAQPQFIAYGSHARDAPAAGTPNQQHREEEEEEEEDDEEIVEEELDHHDAHQGPSTHSSPRPPPPPTAQSSSGFTGPGGATISHQFNTIPAQDHPNQSSTDADGAEKRKPGRPRGSRNRKPRAAPGTASTPTTSSKAPVNSQHPGFYQYPPAPAHAQNQQFYEFQWRALNLCSEFYNAAEELVKAASPVVIAQCYQMGPTTKIDPLAMISEAKRVCDNLLANPSQLVGTPPPPPAPMYSQVPAYSTMPPPPPGNAQGQPAGPSSGPVPMITNPQSFVMSLGATAPQGHPQPYYPPMYAQPGSRYPTTPYYSYAPGTYYAPPAQPQPQSQPQSQSVSAAPATSQPANSANNTASPPSASAAGQSASAPPATGTLSTFNAATGNAAPGGQQGTWSEEETERLRKLAEQSREIGGAQSKVERDIRSC